MKSVCYTKRALAALAKHRNRSAQILARVAAYAADPKTQANHVKMLKGSTSLRLRVGEFRVIFEETATDVVVIDIGPRGEIYD